MEKFIVAGIIATFSSALWLVKYPCEYWESLTFRNHNGIKGHFMSICTVGFLILTVLTIEYLVG